MFKSFFLGAEGEVTQLLELTASASAQTLAVLNVPATEETGEEVGEETMLGLMASDAQTLRHKSFGACTPEELAAVRRIMARIRLTAAEAQDPAHQAGRRHGTSRICAYRPKSMRMHGEPAELYWRRRKVQLRSADLILDVSGSMADYSRHLLQFAYSAKRASTTARVEVFCSGTRLTRITGSSITGSPDDALRLAASTVFDWDGGTRIGACLDAFVRQWAGAGCAGAGSW